MRGVSPQSGGTEKQTHFHPPSSGPASPVHADLCHGLPWQGVGSCPPGWSLELCELGRLPALSGLSFPMHNTRHLHWVITRPLPARMEGTGKLSVVPGWGTLIRMG